MTSGPIPPSAPARTIPSRSIQKWTGRATASHAAAATRPRPARSGTPRSAPGRTPRPCPPPRGCRSRSRRGRCPRSGRRTRSSAGTRPRTAGTGRLHEVDPDRPPIEGGEVDLAAADLGHAERPARPRRRGRGPRRWRRRRSARPIRGRASTVGRRLPGRRRPGSPDASATAAGSGTNATTASQDGERDGDPGRQAGDHRRSRAHPPEGTSTSGRRRLTDLAASLRAVDDLALRLRGRLLPALLTALGVAFLTAGLLSYTAPVEAGPEASEPPTLVTLPPTAEPSPSPSPKPTVQPSATPSAEPTATPDPADPRRHAGGRLRARNRPADRQAGQRQRLPAVRRRHVHPGARPARTGPGHLPLRPRPRGHVPADPRRVQGRRRGGDARPDRRGLYRRRPVYLYEISEVRRHQLDLDDAIAATTEQVWLQTSEGPKGTRPKTQVVARFLSSGPADHGAANPVAAPRVCG